MVRGDSELTEDRLRQDIKAVTMAADKVITVSYSRKTFGQTGELKPYSPSSQTLAGRTSPFSFYYGIYWTSTLVNKVFTKGHSQI